VLAHRDDRVHLDRIDYSSTAGTYKMDRLRRTPTSVLTDIRSIAPTGWFGSPQRDRRQGRRMI
jgi:creatinine amidohydrolase